MESESEGGQKFLPPNPLPFCPPEQLDFKIRNSDFRQKKFEHQSKNTAILHQGYPTLLRSYGIAKHSFGIAEVIGEDYLGGASIPKLFVAESYGTA